MIGKKYYKEAQIHTPKNKERKRYVIWYEWDQERNKLVRRRRHPLKEGVKMVILDESVILVKECNEINKELAERYGEKELMKPILDALDIIKASGFRKRSIQSYNAATVAKLRIANKAKAALREEEERKQKEAIQADLVHLI